MKNGFFEKISEYIDEIDVNMVAAANAASNESGKDLAVLTYTHEGKDVDYVMKHNCITISGKNGTCDDGSVFRIKSDMVENSHVQIRYNSEINRFQIAVYAKTRLNGRLIMSCDKGNPEWTNLANNSKIFMNDAISVKFVIKN